METIFPLAQWRSNGRGPIGAFRLFLAVVCPAGSSRRERSLGLSWHIRIDKSQPITSCNRFGMCSGNHSSGRKGPPPENKHTKRFVCWPAFPPCGGRTRSLQIRQTVVLCSADARAIPLPTALSLVKADKHIQASEPDLETGIGKLSRLSHFPPTTIVLGTYLPTTR